ncbi:unnamed protein product [Rhizophagus irregularis]|nr:unnamed protein product [Rhizophagus irregularis]
MMGGFGPIPASFFGFGSVSVTPQPPYPDQSLSFYMVKPDVWSKYEVYDIIAICVPSALISGSFWHWL